MCIFILVREDIEDDLSELTSEAVPDEVRKWLASTFAKQEQVWERVLYFCQSEARAHSLQLEDSISAILRGTLR
jgi:hypothetical protein